VLNNSGVMACAVCCGWAQETIHVLWCCCCCGGGWCNPVAAVCAAICMFGMQKAAASMPTLRVAASINQILPNLAQQQGSRASLTCASA
jgi:hypothetical protein